MINMPDESVLETSPSRTRGPSPGRSELPPALTTGKSRQSISREETILVRAHESIWDYFALTRACEYDLNL